MIKIAFRPEMVQQWFEAQRVELRSAYGCKVTTKAEYRWFWKAIAWVFWVVGGFRHKDAFMGYTTTIGPLIAFPESTDLDRVSLSELVTLKHEAVHVRQYSNFGLGEPLIGIPLFVFLYLLIPVPAYYSWFRFKLERDAYWTEYKYALKMGMTPNLDAYAEVISGPGYLYAWPKARVLAWFEKQVEKFTASNP